MSSDMGSVSDLKNTLNKPGQTRSLISCKLLVKCLVYFGIFGII